MACELHRRRLLNNRAVSFAEHGVIVYPLKKENGFESNTVVCFLLCEIFCPYVTLRVPPNFFFQTMTSALSKELVGQNQVLSRGFYTFVL